MFSIIKVPYFTFTFITCHQECWVLLRNLVMTCLTSPMKKVLLNVECTLIMNLPYVEFVFNLIIIKITKITTNLHQPHRSKLWLCRQSARQMTQKKCKTASSQTDITSFRMTCHHSFFLPLLPSYARASKAAKISQFFNERFTWRWAVAKGTGCICPNTRPSI